jgi:cell division transport system permease protein
MSKNPEDKFNKRRLRSSYISVVVSISLVLFVLGIFGMLVLNADEISRNFKENLAVNILIQDDAASAEVAKFQKSLQLEPFIKSVEFISKEEAAKELASILDEEFVEFLGYNPLHDAIDIRLKAEYVSAKKLAELEESYGELAFVQDVVYDKPLVEKMNRNLQTLSLFLIGGVILLALIAIALINSSIRLSIYSKRFLIKTMQLVGATKSFIRRPFIGRSLRHGIYGALIASLLMAALIYYLQKWIPGFKELQNPLDLLILGVGIFAAGILISMSCTFFALKKYLKLNTDQLYF